MQYEVSEKRSPNMKARCAASGVLMALCVINGLCALVFGALMMFTPLDSSLAGALGLDDMFALMGNFPLQEVFFRDFFWSGLALALVNGVANTVAVVLAATHRSLALVRTWQLVAGICLIVWCLVELVFLPNPPAVFYLLLGVVQTSLVLWLRY